MRKAISIAAAPAVSAVAVSVANAAEPSRDEYGARVEPICRRNTEADMPIFAGAKEEEVKTGELKLASTHFAKAEAALERTIGQLEAVPQRGADEAKFGKWLGCLGAESALLGRIGKALAAGEKANAQTLSVRLNGNSNLADDAVLAFAFAFDYCRIVPSRFT